MKRIIALLLAVLMMAALFCACGEKKKDSDSDAEDTVTVSKKYDNDIAEKYAKSVSEDDDGNKVYEFDDEAYKSYTRDFNNTISSQITNEVAEKFQSDYGQFCYINDDKKAVIIGVNPGKYDETTAAAEAESIAQQSYSYFQGLADPVDSVRVLFVNCNNQEEVYGEFNFDIK